MHSDSLNTQTGGSPDEPARAPANRLNIREELSALFDGLLFLNGTEFDPAIMGVAERIGMNPVVAYDQAKVVQILCGMNMTEEEAAEFFEFNILGAYVGDSTPIFVALTDDMI